AVQALLGDTPGAEFVAYLFYPVGFIAVIIGRAQLFTENTLYPVVVVLGDRRYIDDTLRLWATVFAANIGGALLFALFASKTTTLRPDVFERLVQLGGHAPRCSSAALFWSGVFGGWVIALVAWRVTASHWTIGQVSIIW